MNEQEAWAAWRAATARMANAQRVSQKMWDEEETTRAALLDILHLDGFCHGHPRVPECMPLPLLAMMGRGNIPEPCDGCYLLNGHAHAASFHCPCNWVLRSQAAMIRKKLWPLIYQRQASVCPVCEKGLPMPPTREVDMDHIVMISRGGDNNLSNLRFLHKDCHHAITQFDGLLSALGLEEVKA